MKLLRIFGRSADDGSFRQQSGISGRKSTNTPKLRSIRFNGRTNFAFRGQYPIVYGRPSDHHVPPDGSCQVSVLAPKTIRSWIKKYRYKQICLNEMISVGLLTHSEMAEEHASNLANRDRMFVIHTKIEPEVLRAAQFVEQRKEFVNKTNPSRSIFPSATRSFSDYSRTDGKKPRDSCRGGVIVMMLWSPLHQAHGAFRSKSVEYAARPQTLWYMSNSVA